MSLPTQILMVYLTAADAEQAAVLADHLVARKVAACVNILGPIQSVYEWKGRVEHASEVALIAKTTRERYADLEAAVREKHGYECPCIVAWPLTHGYMPFLEWVSGQVD